MIEIKVSEDGHRRINNGVDGPENGNQMVDQYIAILMGWALGIMEGDE
jgi:hypothetical protein